MAITVWGVDPSITELEWANLHYVTDTGNWYETVSDSGNQLVPTPGGGTRQTTIASGDCAAAGVLGKSTSAVTVTHDANVTGVNRFDYVVFNIDWAGTNTTGGTIVVRKGSTSSQLPPALTKTPGTSWDIPLALVKIAPSATTFSVSDVDDVRPTRRRSLRYRSTPAAGQSMAAGNTTPNTIATQDVPDPGWPYRLRVYGQIKFTNLNNNGFGKLDININGGSTEADGRAPDKNLGTAQVYLFSAVQAGKVTVRLRMVPSPAMSEPLVTNSSFADFVVEVVPA